jgi:hypothetical protein
MRSFRRAFRVGRSGDQTRSRSRRAGMRLSIPPSESGRWHPVRGLTKTPGWPAIRQATDETELAAGGPRYSTPGPADPPP